MAGSTNMTFTDYVTPIPAVWLNNVNTFVNSPLPTQFLSETSIANLRLNTSTSTAYAYVSGYYTTGDGGGGFYWLNTSDTSSADNGGTIIVDAGNNRWYLQYAGSISILQFGAYNNNTNATTNNTVFANLVTWLNTLSDQPAILFPAGVYAYTSSPNWAIQNAVYQGVGEVHLRYTGNAQAVYLNGSAGANLGLYNITMTNFTVENNGGTDAVYIQQCHHSIFKFKVRSAGSSNAGIHTNFCVCSNFQNCEVSPNSSGGWYLSQQPLYGILVSGGATTQTSYCTFSNTICEGLNLTNGAGIWIDAALGNNFYGGTSEGCATGILTSTSTNGCESNKFFGLDMESNTVQDIYDQGFNNEYIACDTNLLINIIGVSFNVQVFGGLHQSISIASGANYTGLFGLVWNRNGSGTFVDGSNQARIRDCFNHTLNIPGPFGQTSVTAGASPYTYTNTKGRDLVLSVSGGTVTQMELIRNGTGTLIGVTSGFFPLSPGDELQITYSTVPSIWEFDK